MFKIAAGIVLAYVFLNGIDMLGVAVFGTETWWETIWFMITN